MPRLSTAVLSLFVLICMTACTAQRYLEAGDAAAATGDMRGALYHYQRAAQASDRLTRDKDFMAKLAVAESRVAYDEAVRLRAAGDYEPAIEQLRFAMERDPSYEDPKALLPRVRAEASRVRYVRAVQSADAGKLSEARAHLDRALQHDLTNEDASFARASLSPERLADDTPGLATLREGQSLSADRRWTEAEAVLVRAVAEGPGLLTARAALHEARTQLAYSRKLTSQGAARLNERQIGPSMDALSTALEVWPFNDEATGLLGQAKQQRALADAKLTEATEAAAGRDWEQAITLSDGGLAIDRSHAGLASARRGFLERGALDYTALGDEQLGERRLLEAQKAYARAVELDPSLRTARTGLRDTETRLSSAQRMTDAGAGHIETLQMAGAIQVLTQSLDVWPFNKRATQLLGQAKAEQRRAGGIYGNAVKASQQQAWDKAIELADQALAVDRSFAGLIELREQLPARAAADHAEQGANHLANKRLDAARTAFGEALRFVGDSDAALAGMASVYLAEGEALEVRGLHGAALLCYVAGLAYDSKHPIADAYQRAEAAVRDRIGMGLDITAQARPGGAVGPDQVADAVTGLLSGYGPGGLVVGKGNAPYVLELTVGEAKISEPRVGSVNRTHRFTTRELRHNPEYDRVLGQLKREQHVLHSIKSDYDHHVRQHSSAKSHADRMHPGSPPRKPAAVPNQRPARDGGEGAEEDERQRRRDRARYERQMADYERAMADYKRRQQAYQRELSKAKQIKSKCDHIYGSLSRQERIVKKLKHELSCTPHEIHVTVEHRWPYTIETYAKRGRLSVGARLINTATGKAVDQVDHHASFDKRDDLLLNANPEVGLRKDPLDLPSDRYVRGALSADVGESAGPWAVEAAVQHRLGLIFKEVESLRKAGKAEEALEAEVDAAVLLGMVDGKASSKRIGDLSQQHAK